MEWKIGEIFECNGEWYQYLRKCNTHSFSCGRYRAFGCCLNCPIYHNNYYYAKLEKVGKPYKYFIRGSGIIVLQEYMLVNPNYNLGDDKHAFVLNCQNGRIAIETKQNKEDMEEKKQKMDKLVTDYSANKITYKEFEESIVELYADKHTKVNKPKLKEFDLEAAKAGKPVCTRDGRKARIICFDRNDLYPIVALIEYEDGKEMIGAYSKEGQTEIYEIKGTDLMMLTEKKEGWTNIYKGDLYGTLESAKENCVEDSGYIKTIKVDWEE